MTRSSPVTEQRFTFGQSVENIAASEDNPTKRGFFVRYCDHIRYAEYASQSGLHTTPVDNLRASQPATPGCICQDQHRRGYCTEPGCSYAIRTEPATPTGGEVEPVWTVRMNKVVDDEYPPDANFEVLCPNREWKGCIAVSTEDARDCIQKQWAEDHPATTTMAQSSEGAQYKELNADEILARCSAGTDGLAERLRNLADTLIQGSGKTVEISWADILLAAAEIDRLNSVAQAGTDQQFLDDITLAHNARRAAVEECAKIVEGNIVHGQYREWPAYSGQGNRSNDCEIVRLCDRLAAAIRALSISSTRSNTEAG